MPPAGTQLDIANGTGGCDSLCGEGEVCRYTELNPNKGAGGFDNILLAVTNIFQSITLEGWTDLMYMFSVSRPGISEIYFLLVVFFGAAAGGTCRLARVTTPPHLPTWAPGRADAPRSAAGASWKPAVAPGARLGPPPRKS